MILKCTLHVNKFPCLYFSSSIVIFKAVFIRCKENTVLSVQQNIRVQDQESLQSDTLPLTKRTHDNSCHDYKKTLPLPKNKKKKIFPHLTKRQVENLALSSDSDFD